LEVAALVVTALLGATACCCCPCNQVNTPLQPGGGGSRGGGGGSPGGGAPCGLKQTEAFAPAEDSAIVKAWDGADQSSAGMTPKDVADLCRSDWNSFETTHCSKQIDAFCDRACSSDAKKKTCMEPPQREAVMQECRRDSIGVFTAHNTLCKDFKLCKDRLIAPNEVCKAGK
jgi:hypothetical protein